MSSAAGLSGCDTDPPGQLGRLRVTAPLLPSEMADRLDEFGMVSEQPNLRRCRLIADHRPRLARLAVVPH
jgi:hypothetical protein